MNGPRCTAVQSNQGVQRADRTGQVVAAPGKGKELIIRHRSCCRLLNSQSREKLLGRMWLPSAVSKQRLLCCSIKPMWGGVWVLLGFWTVNYRGILNWPVSTQVVSLNLTVNLNHFNIMPLVKPFILGSLPLSPSLAMSPWWILVETNGAVCGCRVAIA